jgi:hypothetical protein
MIITGIVKGDTINLELSIGQNITDWKIRAEIYDNEGHCIKLATTNSGGSSSQIEVTDALNGIFILHISKDTTTMFYDKASIEVEVELTTGEVFTPIIGEENTIQFRNQKITWSTP